MAGAPVRNKPAEISHISSETEVYSRTPHHCGTTP